MVTGISRFTKGEFNQDALDEVWNKGKELNKDPVAPPSSGIILNSTDLIWSDMNDYPDVFPAGTSSSYGFFNGTGYSNNLDGVKGLPDWGSINAWNEIEDSATGEISCGQCAGTSTNTQVELSDMFAWYLDGDVWHQYSGVGTGLGGSERPNPNQTFPNDRGCPGSEVMDEKIAYDSYNTLQSENPMMIRPAHFQRWHGWATNPRCLINKQTIQAVYVMQFTRLVQIDPNQPNDFHLAKFITHVGGDAKTSSGGWCENCTGCNLGGISNFKLVPVNGDWMPTNYLVGVYDRAALEANPPPFPTSPY